MQTETVALSEDEAMDTGAQAELPGVDELMRSLNAMLEDGETPARRARLSGQAVEDPDTEWREMIAPEVIAPDAFDDSIQSDASASSPPTPRFLVYMNADHPISYLLHKDVMTIGRSESADIKIYGDFVSRIHARVVSREDGVLIEDAGSKNGFKINSENVERHELQNGDVIGIGKLHLTFVDPAKD
jgi:pSer/pThr/pTyr-binding forkhead associated (FHA) protein